MHSSAPAMTPGTRSLGNIKSVGNEYGAAVPVPGAAITTQPNHSRHSMLFRSADLFPKGHSIIRLHHKSLPRTVPGYHVTCARDFATG